MLKENNNIERYIHKKNGNTITTKSWNARSKKDKAHYKPDTRHAITFESKGKTKTVYVLPRTTDAELKNARELSRSQIAFGSDPLDEISLTGHEHFYNNSFFITWALSD